MTNVTIPLTVTEIGEGTFKIYTCLTEFTNESAVPQAITLDVFGDVNLSGVTLLVPAEAVEAYRNANVRKEFGAIEAIDAVTEITITAPGESVKKGENLQFTAEVKTRGTASTEIRWSVTSNTSNETTITPVADGGTEGVPTVTANVTAKSVFDDTKYASKAVTVESITSTDELLTPALKAYPNPFTDAIHLTGTEGYTLRVINAANGNGTHTKNKDPRRNCQFGTLAGGNVLLTD